MKLCESHSNPNRIKPPISPFGLEYVAEGLLAAGHEVNILDLCWEEQPEKAIPAFFNDRDYGLVGISIRTTDDCSFATRDSFLPGFSSIVETIRKHSGAPIVAGGVGFSVMPVAVRLWNLPRGPFPHSAFGAVLMHRPFYVFFNPRYR